jgi:hypothetical protein
MEQLLLLVIFILIPLANYVLQRIRRRYQPPPQDRRRMPDMGMRRQAAAPAQTAGVRKRAPETGSSDDRAPRRDPGLKLFRNQRDVRSAVIAMTILGPCRAYEPPER